MAIPVSLDLYMKSLLTTVSTKKEDIIYLSKHLHIHVSTYSPEFYQDFAVKFIDVHDSLIKHFLLIYPHLRHQDLSSIILLVLLYTYYRFLVPLTAKQIRTSFLNAKLLVCYPSFIFSLFFESDISKHIDLYFGPYACRLLTTCLTTFRNTEFKSRLCRERKFCKKMSKIFSQIEI